MCHCVMLSAIMLKGDSDKKGNFEFLEFIIYGIIQLLTFVWLSFSVLYWHFQTKEPSNSCKGFQHWEILPNAKSRNTKFPFYLNHPLVLIENQKKILQANHYILQPTDDWKCFKNSTWQLFACLPNNTNIKLCFMPLFYLDSIYPAFLCVYARFYHFFLSHSDTSDIFWLRAFK